MFFAGKGLGEVAGDPVTGPEVPQPRHFAGAAFGGERATRAKAAPGRWGYLARWIAGNWRATTTKERVLNRRSGQKGARIRMQRS